LQKGAAAQWFARLLHLPSQLKGKPMLSNHREFKAGDKVRALYGAKGEVWGEVISQNHTSVRINATHVTEHLGGRRRRVSFETNVLSEYTKVV
jgi:hypothetical protein